jgi:hypothetical protein
LLYYFFADFVLVLHVFFVLFVVLGGFLALWRSAVAWFHIPAVLWGAAIEFFGWICPLTHLEFMLRQRGGGAVYDQRTGFIEHYIVPILYPAALTRKMKVCFGMTLLMVNIAVYLILWQKIKQAGSSRGE